MGGSYEHLMVLGRSQREVADALGDWRAFLVEVDDTTVVFHEGNMDVTTSALRLSNLVSDDVVGFTVFDDDILGAVICRSGAIVADVMTPTMEEYVGAEELEMVAEYLPAGASVSPATGAGPFVDALARGDAKQAQLVLSDTYREGEHVSATERHHYLLLALGLPEIAAGWDYFGLAGGGNGYAGPAPTHVGN